MEIRYLDLGSVSPEIYTSIWEYDNVVELKEDIATVKTEVKHISETVDKMSAKLALNSEVEELEYAKQ